MKIIGFPHTLHGGVENNQMKIENNLVSNAKMERVPEEMCALLESRAKKKGCR
jgi:hypothetical protein